MIGTAYISNRGRLTISILVYADKNTLDSYTPARKVIRRLRRSPCRAHGVLAGPEIKPMAGPARCREASLDTPGAQGRHRVAALLPRALFIAVAVHEEGRRAVVAR
jgi:hypothetical protein